MEKRQIQISKGVKETGYLLNASRLQRPAHPLATGKISPEDHLTWPEGTSKVPHLSAKLTSPALCGWHLVHAAEGGG